MDKREKILAAAGQVLITENFHTMKTAEIAKKAGIAEGTLYRYFKNKREIFFEALKYYVNDSNQRIFNNISEKNSISKNLEELESNFIRLIYEDKSCFGNGVYEKAFSEVDDLEIKSFLKQHLKMTLQDIKNIFLWAIKKEEIRLSEDQAEYLSTMIWGIAELYFRKHLLGVDALEEEIKNTRKFLIQALELVSRI